MIAVENRKNSGVLQTIKRSLHSTAKWLKSFVNGIFRNRRVRDMDRLYLSLCRPATEGGLSSEQHRSIDSFYSKYKKVRHNSHIFYKSKTGFFYKEFIPDSLYSNYIDQFYNDWHLAGILDNKCYYPRLFSGVNQPEMIAYRLNGFWYDKTGQIFQFDDAVKRIMCVDECFIKKATNSWGGKGVIYCRPSESTVDEIIKHLGSVPVDLVVQAAIKQSPILSAINKDSVNTVRLLSLLRNDGTVKIYSCVLRMGVKGSKVDNASSGGISVGISEDGSLKEIAFSNTGVKYYEHPSTHVKFCDFSIPNFNKMKQIVTELQPQFPHFRLIGWDMACDENNEPVLIEANLCDSELDFHQLNNGPVFGEDTELILQEVFGK